MTAKMLSHVRHILQQKCHIEAGQLVLAGVSGGPDSLAMLDILHQLGQKFMVAHFDHKLRPESSAEAEAVHQLAVERGLPFVSGREDTGSYAGKNMLSIEEAARNLRYRFLFEQAEAAGAQAVLVAHTADDQVETLLMHLLRGSGLAGLTGMDYQVLPNPWSTRTPLIRPLLGIWRRDILAYCRERQLFPLIDQSNKDLTYFRNRLRHELIPLLETYNPAVRETLFRTAEVLSADEEILEKQVDRSWKSIFMEQGQGYLALDWEQLGMEMLGTQRRIVRRAIEQLRPGLRDIDFEMVERVLSYLSPHPHAGRRDIGAGISLLVEQQKAWIAAWESVLPTSGWPQVSPGKSKAFPLEPSDHTCLALSGGWQLCIKEVDFAPSIYEKAVSNRDPYQAWVDADTVELPLGVRPRKPGDRFFPFGMQGHSVKLSDFLINAKLPERARHHWPLVVTGDDLVWVPGYTIGYPYQIKPGTTRILHLSLQKPTNQED